MKNLTVLATVILISATLTACGGGESANTGGGGSGSGGGNPVVVDSGLIIDNGRGTSNGYETEVPN
ncbi:MAG TPA: hypothetical protein EYH38_05855 [Leucothrix sp.]|nr:hypothetical protein [Leucothrix sp.]